MHPSPERAAPRQRGGALAAPGAAARGTGPAFDDAIDQLAPVPVPAPRPPWAHVWLELRDADLDRRHRAVAWQLLHGCLRVGMFTAHIRHHDSAEECLCPHPACRNAAQSLSHVFLECAIARPVVAWLARVWAAVTGGPVPELTAAILLAADDSGWRLEAPLRPLWQRLRLSALWHLWRAAQRSRLPGEAAPTAAAVAGSIVHDCCGALRRDWARVRDDLARGAGVPTAWLRGRSPALSLADFEARWCHRGVLCRLTADAAYPDVRWSVYHPVPVARAAEGVG